MYNTISVISLYIYLVGKLQAGGVGKNLCMMRMKLKKILVGWCWYCKNQEEQIAVDDVAYIHTMTTMQQQEEWYHATSKMLLWARRSGGGGGGGGEGRSKADCSKGEMQWSYAALVLVVQCKMMLGLAVVLKETNDAQEEWCTDISWD
jgi:hypothetical protein